MRVMSLFDGIASCRVALERADIYVDTYYASEIDKDAIKVATTNYPNIIELGDIRYIDGNKYANAIDLLTFGSPCTNFSCSGKKQGMVTKEKIKLDCLDTYMDCKLKGIEFEGQSYLFWEAIRLLNEIKPTYFLMENVKMKDEWVSIITEALGVKPIELNSSLVSAQNRIRLYWTNIPQVTKLTDKHIVLKDILEDIKYINPAALRGRQLNIDQYPKGTKIPYTQCLEVKSKDTDKSNCLTTVAKDNVLTSLSAGRYEDAISNNLPYRYYTVKEYERLQNLTDGYTSCISESKAKKVIGNGWTIDIITHLMEGLSYGMEGC